MKQRREKLLEQMREEDCDNLVAFEPENLFYLTGFWGEAIGLLNKNGRTSIITPALEAERAESESIDCDIIKSDRGYQLDSLKEQLKNTKVCTDCSDYKTINLLKKSTKVKPTAAPFYNARAIKDDAEIRILKQASKIIDEMFELCVNKIEPGQKESELQATLMSFAANRGMFDTGYKSTLNPLIIASGRNSIQPHAQVTNRKFRKNDLVLVDLTLRYKGYVSDATRTFAIGRVSDKVKAVYDIVRESQKLGIQAVRPGTTCKSVDDSCRKFITNLNYGEYFIHSTGHGIGLEVHEPPNVSFNSKTKLEENMTITVEPGIYLPLQFGIRIEDSLIVKDKPYILHKFTKELITI